MKCKCGCGKNVPKAKFPSQQGQYIQWHRNKLQKKLGGIVACFTCGKKNYKKRYQFKRTKKFFCSFKCRKYPHIDSMGYISIRMPNGKRIREHRIIMSKIVERHLKRNEHVHHKNGNTSDNRPENLELMTESSHHRFHAIQYHAKKKQFISISLT